MILSIITNTNYMKITKREFMSKLDKFLNETKSILIVEDESILALGIEYSLQEFGYEVSGIETNYENAIEHVRSNYPDLVLMDIKLKGDKSGIDAAKVIWKEKKIPIIFLTSYHNDKMIQEAMNCEPYAYLLKPCRDKELKIAIKTALHKHNYFFKNKEIFNEEDFIELQNNITFCRSKGILLKGELKIPLTKNEIKLFEILTEYINESVSFERLNDYIWREAFLDIGRLRTLIYRLKKKIGHDIFENIFEYGYRLTSR